MNKTIIININGIVFHIEEDAYEVLRSYMTEVKRHFAYSPDSEEIVTDIENRLAEMFSERLAEQNKQVIVIQDVNEITQRMGSATEFDLDDEPDAFQSHGYRAERKLFRDPDDRVIGGVCAGLGHYFDMEAKWVRLIAFVVTLLWGTGLIVYVILWIILPNARTRAEKMAMKGEPINLQNFKKNFDEEIEALRHQVRPGLEKTEMFIRRAGQNTGSYLEKALKVLIKIIGAFVIVICSLTLFSVLMGLLFVLGFLSGPELQTFPLNIVSVKYQSPLYFSIFLLVVIPLIALILFGIRVIFNRKVAGKTTSFALLIIWITGLGMTVYYGSKVGAEFKEEASVEQKTDLKFYPTYYIKLNKTQFLTKEDSIRYKIHPGFKIKTKIKFDEDFGRVNFYIENSDDGKVSIIKEFTARGRNFENAIQNAQKSMYRFSQTDSVIELDKYLYLTEKAPYRVQEVKVTLRVPANTRLIINGEVNEVLHNFNLRDCLAEDAPWDSPSSLIMNGGELRCIQDTTSTQSGDL